MSIREIDTILAAKAAATLNEDRSRTESDINMIKNWLKKQPHLFNLQISDQRILTFLRGCKFSIERCKEKLDMYYTIRNLLPEFFSNRDPMDPEIQECLNSGAVLPFLKLNDDGETVICIRLKKCDHNKFSFANLLKTSFMITDILMNEDDNYTINGQVILIDLDDINFSFASQVNATVLKKLVICIEKIYPLRIRGHHMINLPLALETLLLMFKRLVSDKFKERIFIHGDNLENFFKYISKDIIPKDMGGDAESFEELTDYWKKKLESYRDWFIEEDKNKSDESKRLGKPKTTEEMFGVDGTFRQLNVD